MAEYLDASVTSLQVLVWIVRTSVKVKRHRKQCEEISELASIIYAVLRTPGFKYQDYATSKRLDSLVQNLRDYVQQCTESYNVAQVTWEVVWRRKLPSLLLEIKEWVMRTILQNTVTTQTIVSDLRALQETTLEHIDVYQVKLEQIMQIERADLRQMVDEHRSIENELGLQRANIRPTEIQIAFRDGDTRLSILGDESSQGVLKGMIEDVPVKCHLLGGSLWPSITMNRSVTIYHLIAQQTLVLPFYGIAQLRDQYWAVLADVDDQPSLGEFLTATHYPTDLRLRLRLAYDIAKTVAYLHSLGIVIKSLSDTQIKIVQEGELFQPLFIDLQYARKLLAQTDAVATDVRYEAPEYQNVGCREHSIETDLWSLGILIWQCLTQRSPYNISQPVSASADADLTQSIRGKLSHLDNEFCMSTFGIFQLNKHVDMIIQGCMATRPSVRSPADGVARAIYNLLADTPILDSTPESSEVQGDDFLTQVGDMIHSLPPTQPQLPGDMVRELEHLAEGGDAKASYVLGSALIHDKIGVEQLDEQLAPSSVLESEKVSRAKLAARHLAFAADCGVKDAAGLVARAYRRIVQHYENLEDLEHSKQTTQ